MRYVRERFKATTIQSDFDAGATILGIVNLQDGRYRVDRLVGGQVVSTIESSIPEGSVGIGL